MIKKSIFEDELITAMQQQLVKQGTQREFDHLEQAAEYLNSAAEIFEDMGMAKNAEEVIHILYKIAEYHHDKTNSNHKDPHVKGLTPDKMVMNLKEHGIVFNI